MGDVVGHVEETDCAALVAVVGEANRQEGPTSHFLLQSFGDTGDPDCHLNEGLEGLRADDVRVSPCVCDSLGIDLGGSCGLAD